MTDTYDSATRPCSGHATSGAVHLQSGILEHWAAATNVGIYVCRPTADGAPSVHGNGRAGDIGITGAVGSTIADWLVANHTVLGVQIVIWNHRIWSVARAGEGWRPYGCDKPGSKKDHHTTHIHDEINIDAATRLTPQIIDSVLPHQPTPNPQPPLSQEDDMELLVPVGQPGDPDVGAQYARFGDVAIALRSTADLQQLANSYAGGDINKLPRHEIEPGLWQIVRAGLRFST